VVIAQLSQTDFRPALGPSSESGVIVWAVLLRVPQKSSLNDLWIQDTAALALMWRYVSTRKQADARDPVRKAGNLVYCSFKFDLSWCSCSI